jgi:two-component system, LytTR family, response regulator LytT
MEKIKILIVEDEILIAEDLKDILASFNMKLIAMAHDKRRAFQLIEEFKPQIVLLDIRMEGEKDGLEIGEYLNNKTTISFIYITAHSDVAMVKKIIETQPAGYITKPIKKSDLYASINLALSRQQMPVERKMLKVKDGYSFVLIPLDEILYLESDGNYVHVISENRKLLVRQSLDSIAMELESEQFFKVHRSYIVNTSHVIQYSRKEVKLKGHILPISRNLSDEFEKFMQLKN